MTTEDKFNFNFAENAGLRDRSGHVDIDSKLVSFLYQLMRDHLNCADVEELVQDSMHEGETKYTNGYLARYAEDVANRLTNDYRS